MMNNPFLDMAHRVSPSTNRVRIVELPGIDLPPAVKGKSAFDLLSDQALQARICEHAAQLRIQREAPHLLHSFDACFTADAPGVRAVAEAIARDFGLCLGYVLLTLKRGDAANQAARPDWDERHWAYWGAIDCIWLGGGLLAGQLGRRVPSHAWAVLHEAGYNDYRLDLSPYAGMLPLVGAARYAPPHAGAALVFDFGHTSVKRACAFYEAGAVVGMHQFASVTAPCAEALAGDDSAASLARQWQKMLALLAETWAQAKQMGLNPGPVMIVSLACYLRQGHPYPFEMGCYGRLQRLSHNLQTFFTACLSERLARPLTVKLIHDATAAAAVYAGALNTVILTLGTAIGTGFPPPATALRPLKIAP